MRTETSLTLYFAEATDGKLRELGRRVFNHTDWPDGYWEEESESEFRGKKGKASKQKGEERVEDADYVSRIGTTDLLDVILSDGAKDVEFKPAVKKFLKITGVKQDKLKCFYVAVRSEDDTGLIGTNMVCVSRDGIRAYDDTEEDSEGFPRALTDLVDGWNREGTL
ncbi:MAG: hypothetical protein IJ052_01495 [Oscillospiraceae bacterium]|nr:hypothetical protein [Oscillospiraceae bacterium]